MTIKTPLERREEWVRSLIDALPLLAVALVMGGTSVLMISAAVCVPTYPLKLWFGLFAAALGCVTVDVLHDMWETW